MQLQIAIHNHRHGFSYYPFFLPDGHPPIGEDYVLEHEDIDFESDRDEDITILSPIHVEVPLMDRLEGLAIIAANKPLTAREIIEKTCDDDLILALGDMAEILIREGVL